MLASTTLRIGTNIPLPYSIVNEKQKSLAVGLVNYESRDVERIKGLKTTEIERALGYKHYDEVVHKDNLVLMSTS